MKKVLTKEEIVKAANWLQKKVELEKQLAEHLKFCCHWSVEQQTGGFDKSGHYMYDVKNNICEFCNKELDYYTYADTATYNYPKKMNSHSYNKQIDSL